MEGEKDTAGVAQVPNKSHPPLTHPSVQGRSVFTCVREEVRRTPRFLHSCVYFGFHVYFM